MPLGRRGPKAFVAESLQAKHVPPGCGVSGLVAVWVLSHARTIRSCAGSLSVCAFLDAVAGHQRKCRGDCDEGRDRSSRAKNSNGQRTANHVLVSFTTRARLLSKHHQPHGSSGGGYRRFGGISGSHILPSPGHFVVAWTTREMATAANSIMRMPLTVRKYEYAELTLPIFGDYKLILTEEHRLER